MVLHSILPNIKRMFAIKTNWCYSHIPIEERASLPPFAELKSRHVCWCHQQSKFCRKTHWDVYFALSQNQIQEILLFPNTRNFILRRMANRSQIIFIVKCEITIIPELRLPSLQNSLVGDSFEHRFHLSPCLPIITYRENGEIY